MTLKKMARWTVLALAVIPASAAMACGGDGGSDETAVTADSSVDETPTSGQPPTVAGTATNTPVPPTATNTVPPALATGTAVAGKFDACDLIPASEANALASASFGAPRNITQLSNEDPSITISSCTYTASPAAVQLVLQSGNAEKVGLGYDSALRAAKSPANVSGVGDKAFWWPEEGQFNILKGDAWLIIKVVPTPGGDSAPAALVEQAKKSLGRVNN
ncbi:hypothetical protein AYO38_04355 [bacterium SCGC AG-212-C10]|nr:hypothetical protein AYO38_04355 [bacterium SCGC AG-212-C10]